MRKDYRSLKRRGRSGSILERGKFNMENAKWYLMAVIICFHIVPLIFIIFGQTGRELLTQGFLVYLNPMLLFLILLIYGVKNGFDFKMPIISSLFAGASIVMYYNMQNASYTVMAAIILTLVYTVFTYLAAVVGGIIKHYLD